MSDPDTTIEEPAGFEAPSDSPDEAAASEAASESGRHDQGRFSSARKAEAVLAVLKGRPAMDIARIHRVHLATLERWRDEFVAAGQEALRGCTPATPARDEAHEALAKRVRELRLENLVLAARARAAESGRELSSEEIEELASRVPSEEACDDRPLGLKRTCELLGVPRSTLYARRARGGDAPRKRGPKTLWSDEDLLARIREILDTSLFEKIGHRKVWERLRLKGIETSRGRVLRLMREQGLLAFDPPDSKAEEPRGREPRTGEERS